MATLNQSQADQLAAIKAQLGTISDTLGSLPESERARIENTDIGAGISSVLSGASNYLSGLKNENGVLTSKSAQTATDNSNGTFATSGDLHESFINLQQQYAKLQSSFKKEQAAKSLLESEVDVANQRLQQTTNLPAPTQGQDTQTGTGTADLTGTGQGTAEAADGSGISDITGQTGLENDFVGKALIDAFNEKNTLIGQQMQSLKDYIDITDEETKSMVKRLEATATRQIASAEKENARLAQASRYIGITTGMGQYDPYTHESIISETIQEGLDRIADIETTRDNAIFEAKKAQREFNYEAYVQMSDMAIELADMKRQTIMDINTRLNEIETNQREKMRFDQEQADRNAFILAPELMDATPEEIARAAAANGIEVGALMREVQAYKDEQTMNQLDIANKQADLEGQRLSNYLAQLKADGTDASLELTPMDKGEQEQFFTSYGWQPPFGMSMEEALRIEETYAGEPGGVKTARAKEIMVGNNRSFVEISAEDIKTLADSDENVAETIKQITKELGVTNWLGKARKTDELMLDSNMQSYIQQAIAEGEAQGVTLSTRQMVDLIAAMVTEDKLAEKAAAKAEAERQQNIAQPQELRTANTTQAVILK